MQNLRVARDTPTKTVPGNTCDAPAAVADKRPNFEGTALDPLVYDQSLGVTNGAAGKVSGCGFSRWLESRTAAVPRGSTISSC
jgi:hypothetical protein